MKPPRLTFEPTEEDIRHTAYLLWESEGRPAGRDAEIWFAAKERLCHALTPRARNPVREKYARHRPRDAQAAVTGGR